MKKYLLTGLVLLLPLALTIAIIGFVVNFLTKPFMGMVSHLLAKTEIANKGFLIFSPEQTIRLGSQFIILVCLFLVILIIGMIARWYLVNWVIQMGDKLLHRLPLINKVYRTTKDIITHLFGRGKNTFRQVVMVPFPGESVYTLGLLSYKAPRVCSESVGSEMKSVFIPTAPNPTTGFTVMFKETDIHYVDMKTEDAIKYIVSCGMVTPPEPPVDGKKAPQEGEN